jgi:hypothetical protein
MRLSIKAALAYIEPQFIMITVCRLDLSLLAVSTTAGLNLC